MFMYIHFYLFLLVYLCTILSEFASKKIYINNVDNDDDNDDDNDNDDDDDNVDNVDNVDDFFLSFYIF